MKITVELLKQLGGASCDEVQTFSREWPDGTDVTPESVARAVNLKLDIDWLARHVLKDKALAEYERVTDAALDEYDRVADVAWAECQRVAAAAFLEAAEAAEGASDEIT